MSAPDAAAIRAWLTARLGDVDPDRPLHETGLSSRDATSLAADLGEFVGRPLAPTLVWQYPTIAALAHHLSDVDVAAAAVPLPEDGEPIAVVGLGCRLPGGIESPEAFWRFLAAGGDGIGDVPEGRWETFAPAADLAGVPARGGFLADVAGFDAGFFGITPREAEAMDPQQRILLEVVWAALEHAGIPPSSLRGSRTGVFVGLSATEYGSLTMTDVARVDVWSGTGAAASIAANRLSYLLDLRGPSLTLDTACSSSLVAVHQAVQSLRRGESELALVAGVNVLLSPGITAGFHRAGVLAADGRCKPFDAGADGIARGEGCGVVVLKPLRAARGDRVLAVIRGSAVNSDGRSNGLTAPNPEAQAALLRDAYATAGVDPSSVDYVEAHGTGTPLGDPLEAGALAAVLGERRAPERPLLIGSVKSNLGHLEGAAGITGLLKVVLAMTHRRLPPSLHFREPNPHIDFTALRVVATGTDWPRYSGTARAGVSAFGFGGTNAHVVLEEWPAAAFPPRAGAGGPQVFALSARSAEVLRARAGELAEWLEESEAPLDAVAATLAHRREHLPVRGAVVGESRGEVVEALRSLAAGTERPNVAFGASDAPNVAFGALSAPNATLGRWGERGVVFVFSGYGSQWSGMGRLLLGAEPAFRAEIEALDPVFRAEAGFSLREALEHDLPDLAATQLALFGMQLALAALWRAHDVVPAAVLGHSMGEVAAAVVAGALDVAGGLRVMAARARLLAELDERGGGAMAVVELTPAELAAFPDVTIAVYASPTQCTVSGAADRVDAVVAHAEGLGRLARRLPVGGAGHSAAVEPVLGPFRAAIAGLTPATPEIRCYSSVSDDQPTFDAEYWAANLRRPVRFSQALAAAAADGHTVFVEISPHPVALAAIEQSGVLGLPSASRRIDERTAFLTSLARLHVLGGDNLALSRPGVPAGRPQTPPVELPGPVWRHERFWPRPAVRAAGTHPLLGVHIEDPGGGHLWRGDVGIAALPWLAGHTVGDTPVFPATGFLELALAAAGPGGRVRDLELQEVLPLGEHTEVTTSLRGTELSVHTRAGSWVRHATARLATGGTPSAPFGETTGEPFDVYRALAELGQSYGPAFRGLRRVVAAPGRASASIAQPESDHPAYVLHPALADACLHALAAAVGDAEVLYLPLSMGEVLIAGDPRRGVRVDAVLQESGDGVLGSVQLVDATDAVLVEFRDVYCRPYRDAAVTRLLFEAAWQPVPLPAAPELSVPAGRVENGGRPRGPERAQRWIVLSEDDREFPGEDVRTARLGDRAELAKLLRDGEPTAVLALLGGGVEPLAGDAAERDPACGARLAGAAAERDPAHGATLAGAAAELDPVRGATLAGVVAEPDPVRGARLVETLSGVVAELAELPVAPRLWLVSDGAHAIKPGEPGDPGLAALRGLVRVLAFEHPELRVSHLDGTDRLHDEIRADGPDDEIAWRGGVRYVRRLGRPAAGDPVREPVRDGAYVITGGLGGLGLAAAKWLAARGATRLVLNSRHAADPGLGELGVDVRVVPGDIAAPGTAETLVAVAVDGGVPLRGVLHAAGVLADGAAISLDADALEAVWRPKALGAWRLHEATAGHDLDWWLVYSSAAALFGSPGQAAYATANAWADALVAWRRAHGLPAATIGWGAWGEVGAAAGAANPVLDPLGTEEALAALEFVLARDRGATGVARVDSETVLALFPRLGERPFFGLFSPPAESSTWDGLDALRSATPEAARTAIGDHLAGLVADLLGLAEVDRTVPLTRLGLDSLSAMRARGAVEQDFGVPLPIPLLLRGASLAELAGYLAEQAGFGPDAPAGGTGEVAESAGAGAGSREVAESAGAPAPVAVAPRKLAEPVVTESAGAAAPIAVGPRDPAERWVARHWRAILGTPEPSVHEPFGGDATQARRLHAAFAEHLTAVPAPARLFATPTIAAMADLLRAELEGHGGGPVRLLRDGVADPVFLFHPAGGTANVYRELARLLPEGPPVYALERLDDLTTVETKAARYAELIRGVQPHGPYRLGGWSFGGCLAYETARHLKPTELVFLIDTILPLPATGTPADELLDRFDRFAGHISRTYGVPFAVPRADLANLDEDAQLRWVMTKLAEQVPDLGEGVLKHQYESYVDARVAERYTPRRYGGRVVLLRAGQPHPLTTALDPRYLRTDDTLGWDEHCTDLEVVRVPGDHVSMIDPPHVHVLADRLGAVVR
ncbi:phthiocerol/phenolphthiocerol synthesis type-I polyketide synthase D [Amycolatopsis tolypomycina]|uniref:Phthiocerol/phenolphthiocerol synthesis type-I polyketide synthase D n=1 Tax=Amycolatopsis tolypomycina TaxID=208445 RepID=A0A1H4X574_9PSEU|nr:type I polyketide synthase [Amycolatopsis tolypomycina]SEC99981.1 phthiocerol/phenolphthiocerol synthesis type-I polyketide synthase D [Amycolatopsis tolypomycina]